MNDTEKLITAMGMMAENMQRQAIGESMAYPEIAFQELLKDHKCGGVLCIVCGYNRRISGNKKDVTLEEVDKIQKLKNSFKNDVSGWQVALKTIANQLGISDEEVLEINRGDIKL